MSPFLRILSIIRRNHTTLKLSIVLSMMFDHCTQFPQNLQSTLIMNICLLCSLIAMAPVASF